MGGKTNKMIVIAAGLPVIAMLSPVWAADFPIKAPAPAEVVEARWNATFASEVRYFSWESDRGYPSTSGARGHGSQLYVPVAAQIVGRPVDDLKVDIVARGGWVWSKQSTGGLSGEIATGTDTSLSGTVTYLGFNGVQPFVALLANLPTGLSVLTPGQVNSRMDPDLVEISSYGEGLNLGPTFGLNVALSEAFLFTASAGYTWRDAYLRDKSLAAIAGSAARLTDIDPGDVWTISASIAAQFGQFSSVIAGSASWESVTTENGMALYRAGSRYLVSGTFNYAWDSLGVTTLTASVSHSKKNQVLFLGGAALQTELANTNSNMFKAGLQHLFPFGSLWLGPTVSYLVRDNNGYEPNTLQFVPAKERWAAGAVARYAASDKLTFNARVEHVWTHEDENLANNGGLEFSVLANALVPGSSVPVVSSTGWQAAAGFNLVF